MTFKPRTWYPIAAILSVANVGAVWFAAAPGEATHATLHAALAVAFGLWAQRLRRQLHGGAGEHADLEQRSEQVDLEVEQLRRQLGEAEERLDFTERMLVQMRDPERVQRRDPGPADPDD